MSILFCWSLALTLAPSKSKWQMCVLTDESVLCQFSCPPGQLLHLSTPPPLFSLFLVQVFLYIKSNVQPCSLTHTFPILVPILILKDLLNHIILSYQSLSNLSYSCCMLMLPKNPAKKSCSPLIFCTPLLTYPWANVNMAWVSTFILASSCFSSGNLLPEMSK